MDKFTKVSKNQMPMAQLISDGVDFDGYDMVEPIEYIDKCKAILATAKKEVPHEFDVVGRPESDAVREWLRGLPSIVSIPFMYHDIYQWLYKYTDLEESSSEKKHIAYERKYWDWAAHNICMYARKSL